MKDNKTCCRIFNFVLLFISILLTLLIWYFDEGAYRFTFLTNKGEIFNFIGTILFILILPIGIFYLLNDKEKYQSKAKVLALLGFIPSIIVLLINLLSIYSIS